MKLSLTIFAGLLLSACVAPPLCDREAQQWNKFDTAADICAVPEVKTPVDWPNDDDPKDPPKGDPDDPKDPPKDNPDPDPKPPKDKGKSNSGRGNGSEGDPDQDPGNSGGHNRGGD